MSHGSLGFLLLGIWVFLSGLIPIVGLSFAYSSTLMAILALVAGLLIIISHRPTGWGR